MNAFRNMKKIFFLGIFVFVFSSIFAQVQSDPNDIFYIRAQNWEMRGLTKNLPQLRPYPLNVIEAILEDVIENGNENDVQTAKEEYERIFSRKWHVYAEANGILKISHEKTTDSDGKHHTDTSKDKNLTGEVGIAGDIRFHNLVSVGYRLGIYGEKEDFDEFSPYAVNKVQDSIFDPASVGPFESYLDWNTNIAVGNTHVYGTAGVNRTGYGPFYGDGLALNDTAYHSANLLLNYTGEKFSYSSVFESIGATNNLGQTDNHWLNSGKYLAFHSVKYHLFEKLDVSYYENIVFGPRMNIAYLFPAPYMAIQNIGGANDNLQMGLLFEVKPFNGFKWATDIFADDVELNDVVKLNFDTKIRIAAQTGFIFAPQNAFCTIMSLNYTAVMPYTYAHWEYENDNNGYISGSTWNYQNYTNSGVNIGSSLDPNSDKISFYARFNPVKSLFVNFGANFIRHANSAEAFDEKEALTYMIAAKGTYSTNGTASMHQMFSNSAGSAGTHVDSAWEKLGFMTSSHKMYVYQGALNLEYSLPKTKFGQVTFKAGYTFEYIKNAGVNSNVYPGGGVSFEEKGISSVTYDPLTALYTVKHTDNTETSYYWIQLKYSNDYIFGIKPAVEAAKESWVNSLYDVMNNYISVGVKIAY